MTCGIGRRDTSATGVGGGGGAPRRWTMDGTRVKSEEFTALRAMGLGGAGKEGDMGRAAVPFAAGMAASCWLRGC